VLLLLTVRGQVIRLQQNEHAYARAAQEDGAREEIAVWIRDRGVNLHEADSGAESVYRLDLDALEGVGGFVEFMVRVGGLEREV
jgi:hypothetical protein